jgi:hypothetical protein
MYDLEFSSILTKDILSKKSIRSLKYIYFSSYNFIIFMEGNA